MAGTYAAVGALAAGCWLILAVGVTRSIWIAAGLNLLAALLGQGEGIVYPLLARLGIDPAAGPALADLVTVQADRVKTLKEMAEASRAFYEEFDDFDEEDFDDDFDDDFEEEEDGFDYGEQSYDEDLGEDEDETDTNVND